MAVELWGHFSVTLFLNWSISGLMIPSIQTIIMLKMSCWNTCFYRVSHITLQHKFVDITDQLIILSFYHTNYLSCFAPLKVMEQSAHPVGIFSIDSTLKYSYVFQRFFLRRQRCFDSFYLALKKRRKINVEISTLNQRWNFDLPTGHISKTLMTQLFTSLCYIALVYIQSACQYFVFEVFWFT